MPGGPRNKAQQAVLRYCVLMGDAGTAMMPVLPALTGGSSLLTLNPNESATEHPPAIAGGTDLIAAPGRDAQRPPNDAMEFDYYTASALLCSSNLIFGKVSW
jgi:hypothetical protein